MLYLIFRVNGKKFWYKGKFFDKYYGPVKGRIFWLKILPFWLKIRFKLSVPLYHISSFLFGIGESTCHFCMLDRQAASVLEIECGQPAARLDRRFLCSELHVQPLGESANLYSLCRIYTFIFIYNWVRDFRLRIISFAVHFLFLLIYTHFPYSIRTI